MQKIAASLRAAYPGLAAVDGMIAETQQIYQDNFFPEMKTDWRDASRQHRPQNLARLFPLPRRQPRQPRTGKRRFPRTIATSATSFSRRAAATS